MKNIIETIKIVIEVLSPYFRYVQSIAEWIIAISAAATIIWKWKAIVTYLRQRLGGSPALLIGVTGASYPNEYVKFDLINLSSLNTLVIDIDVSNNVGDKFELRVGLPMLLKPDSKLSLEVFASGKTSAIAKEHKELKIAVCWKYIDNKKEFSKQVTIPINNGSIDLSKQMIRRQ